ncbi:Protein of unknown function (DUF2917) [Acidovorax sp. CF316]|uniref:DUF2917 domain-containing protein n=1 Tax=Acidovorax sp. CF316 TaxID=1144317 RepID=UPI00026BD416|nr:DUF2917 domain-containing protein [Acidovorax sp. CF316]EJE50650.1 Protein of unknown function (DUF2917) [Acidovorax sp. CF316]
MMIELAHRGLHQLPDAAGQRIQCQSGTVWITLDHDTRDVVLEQGESFSSPEHKRALVYALSPARLLIEPPVGGKPVVRAATSLHNAFPAARAPVAA